MLIPILIWTTSVVVLFIFFKWFFMCMRVYYYIDKLDGPKGWPMPVGHVPLVLKCDETLFKSLRRWGLDHYPMYQLGTSWINCVNIVGPEECEQVLSTSKHNTKSPFYIILYRWLKTGLLTSSGDKWHTRRKMLTPTFHFSILQKFVTILNRETNRLVDDIKASFTNEKELSTDVIPMISRFTLYTINETSMGTKLQLDKAEDKEYKDAILEIGKLFVHRMVRPWLWFWFYYYIYPGGIREKKLIKIMHNFTSKVINEKSQEFIRDPTEHGIVSYSKKKNLALLDLLLNVKFNTGAIDDEGIREEVDTFMFEGHDTISMGISFCLMLLAANKDAQDLIVQEMEQVLGKEKKNPSYNELMELNYTERCIKEALRIYPSVPFISRILDDDIVTKSGHILPKESVVNIHIFDLHHSPKIYENPEKFDPDRFLPENVKSRHPYSYLPFSAGPRNCIGQKFALLEIKAVLCGILRNFILEPIDTPETIVIIPDMILRPKNGIRVKFVKRT